jgi:hypothetical protein
MDIPSRQMAEFDRRMKAAHSASVAAPISPFISGAKRTNIKSKSAPGHMVRGASQSM